MMIELMNALMKLPLFSTACQFLRVQASGTKKKPKIDMKVPASTSPTGRTVIVSTMAKTIANAGHRQRPSDIGWDLNFPVIVVKVRRLVYHCWNRINGKTLVRTTMARMVACPYSGGDLCASR